MAKEKELYDNLRKSFIFYEHHRKYHEENLEQIIKLSRKMGIKQMMRYAFSEDNSLGSSDAKEVKARLTQFVRDYYETGLLLSTIYGTIKLLGEPNTPEINDGLVEAVDSCMSFYLEYDGIKDSDVISIISFIRENGILKCLSGLKYCYTSSGFKELRATFEKVEDKYLPLLEVLSALNPFLKPYPIAEIA